MRILIAILCTALALPAGASFHLWYINEVYSNADGSVQFIELKAAASGQQFVKNHTIRSTAASGGATNSYTLPNDLPGDSAEGGDGGGYYGGYGSEPTYKTFLIATQGFAALNIVAPDFVVPNGFLFPAGGTINWGEGSDTVTHGALPTDNRSITRDRTPQTPTPLNFAGVGGTVPAVTAAASYQGLWLRTPFDQEGGWGINFTHQGTTLFGTWFTYDADGAAWFVMDNLARNASGGFQGAVYRTTGPGFDAANFTAIGASNYTQVGTLSVTFSDANTGSMTYTINGVTQTKPIARYVFASTPPTCSVGGTAGSAVNYSDLWWRSAAESGWGVNIVHQGDTLFATWFTYQSGGTAAAPAKGMWLSMSNGNKTGTGVYTGVLARTTGPNAFSATTPFNPTQVHQTAVGDATFTFTDANNGTFRYTVDGITQTKPITRLVFGPGPMTVCR